MCSPDTENNVFSSLSPLLAVCGWEFVAMESCWVHAALCHWNRLCSQDGKTWTEWQLTPQTEKVLAG